MPRITPTAEQTPAKRPCATDFATTKSMSWPGVAMSASEATMKTPSAGMSMGSGFRSLGLEQPLEVASEARRIEEGRALSHLFQAPPGPRAGGLIAGERDRRREGAIGVAEDPV